MGRSGVEPRALPLPTFVIIGAQKSATRWLRLNLGQHPDIFAVDREVEFFNNGERFESLGVEWYRAQFEGWDGEPIVGEATPGYMFWRHNVAGIADRMLQVVPDARLVATLRNPIDRAQSALIHHVEGGALPRDSELIDVVRRMPVEKDPLGIVTGGWYAASLAPFRERFGDRLLAVLHDDIDDDPRGVYDCVLRHLGAATDFVPRNLDKVRYSYQQQKSSDPGRRPLTPDERRALWPLFSADVAELARMIGRDLSRWDPT